jgi:hypothetical protein
MRTQLIEECFSRLWNFEGAKNRVPVLIEEFSQLRDLFPKWRFAAPNDQTVDLRLLGIDFPSSRKVLCMGA